MLMKTQAKMEIEMTNSRTQLETQEEAFSVKRKQICGFEDNMVI